MTIIRAQGMNTTPGVLVSGENNSLEDELANTTAQMLRISYQSYEPWFNFWAGELEKKALDYHVLVFKAEEYHGRIKLQTINREEGTSDFGMRDFSANILRINRPKMGVYFNTPDPWTERDAFLDYLSKRNIPVR